MQRSASAQWKGDLKQGRGEVSTQSGVLEHSPFGFTTRFEDSPGTNPEELIAAAHACCFSMAMSGNLGEAGLIADSLHTTATVSLSKQADGYAITRIQLNLTAKIPGADQNQFLQIAEKTKVNCPVSKVLNAEISLEAQLEQE